MIELSEDSRKRVAWALVHPELACPCLLIGRPVQEFNRVYRGQRVQLQTIKDIKILVERTSQVTNAGVLALTDLSDLPGERVSSALLKFIEESTFPIYLLASYDNLSSVILSRVRWTVKQVEPLTSRFGAPRSGLEALERLKDGAGWTEEVRAVVGASPVCYSLMQRLGRRRNQTKFLEAIL